MIRFHFNNNYRLPKRRDFRAWIAHVIVSEGRIAGDINYIFTGDEELLDLNRQYLKHDYYTDILTFDYSLNKVISGDIYISTDRVKENALRFKVDEGDELRRVMIHGILHLIGYMDSTEREKLLIRRKENEKMKLFHVEQ